MLHKEGNMTISLAIVVLGLLNFLSFTFFPELAQNIILGISILIMVVILQFFRNPSRNTVVNPKHIIAPADGKVVVIEDTEESEYFKGMRKQISIFMSPFNVHVNRNPVSGVVSFFKYHPGKYLMAWDPKSSTENERTTVVVKTDDQTEILFRQIAGFLARRIVWYVKEGQPVMQGKEFGFIKFGSRVDVFVPLDSKVKVEINQKVRGGETVIAELV
ncbi:MAG: phosphatidylserine decarboxylase family protein [Cytophagales bacterium]